MKKVVLITGASAGMGKETAKLLAQKGFTVYGAARRTDKLKELEQYGVKTIAMDVTDDASMIAGVQHIISKENRIDILVNNAGFGSYGAIEDVSIQDARYQLEVNVFGAARLIQLVLPYMRANQYGKIVNISSIGGKMATPFGGWYHASKFALEGLSDSLRNEVKPFGIDVIVIEPGGIKSEWSDIAFESLVRVSGKNAYKDVVNNLGKAFSSTTEKNHEPTVIAEIILKAITATRPKIRYVAGYMAKPAVFLRKWTSDRMMDRIVMSQVKSLSKK
jgi:short-subunit dehydrogenase